MPEFRVTESTSYEPLSDEEGIALNADTHDFYTLNATAKCIFEALDRGESLDTVCLDLAARFAISAEACRSDVLELVHELQRAGLVERVAD